VFKGEYGEFAPAEREANGQPPGRGLNDINQNHTYLSEYVRRGVIRPFRSWPQLKLKKQQKYKIT
jgi:hypothetical protein